MRMCQLENAINIIITGVMNAESGDLGIWGITMDVAYKQEQYSEQ